MVLGTPKMGFSCWLGSPKKRGAHAASCPAAPAGGGSRGQQISAQNQGWGGENSAQKAPKSSEEGPGAGCSLLFLPTPLSPPPQHPARPPPSSPCAEGWDTAPGGSPAPQHFGGPTGREEKGSERTWSYTECAQHAANPQIPRCQTPSASSSRIPQPQAGRGKRRPTQKGSGRCGVRGGEPIKVIL